METKPKSTTEKIFDEHGNWIGTTTRKTVSPHEFRGREWSWCQTCRLPATHPIHSILDALRKAESNG